MKTNINLLLTAGNEEKRNEMASVMEEFSFVTIRGTVENGQEMILQAIENTDIDALVIVEDGKAPSGIESYMQLMLRNKKLPAIVIAEMPLEAGQLFNLDVVDYIEKPYTHTRLENALEKLFQHVMTRDYIQSGGVLVPIVQDRIEMISPSDIIFIESVKGEGEVTVHTATQTYKSKIALNLYKEYLLGFGFYSPHRSYLINVREVQHFDTKEGKIYFKNTDVCAFVAENKIREIQHVLLKNVSFRFG